MAMASKKHNKTLIFAIMAAFALLAIAIATTPKKIDWSYSFSKDDKIPFGNKILFELLPKAFPNQKIVTSHTTLIEFLDKTSLTGTNIIIINKTYEPDSLETERLLATVADGNNVFIAASSFSKLLTDTFKLRLHESFGFNININTTDSVVLNFANRKLKTPYGYVFKKAYDKVRFESYDTLKTTVLGHDERGKTNFIAIKHGKGELFINCNPLLFTNYNMVSDNHSDYIFKCISYLPQWPVVWDEYYKSKLRPGGSMIGFIIKNEALHRAWLLLLALITVYLVFEAKRRQRVIPIVMPPANTSLQFIETIGRLYFSRKNHLDIAKKKYTYFIDYVRTNYYINLNDANQENIKDLSSKTTIPLRTIEQIVQMGQRLSTIKQISEEDLINFNQKIEFFYHNCK
jgi:hypothetical protein